MVSIFPWPCWFTECTRNDWNWNIYFALNWSPASWKIATSPNHNSSRCRLKTLKNKRKYRVWFFAFPKKWSFHLLQAWHRENHPETRSQNPWKLHLPRRLPHQSQLMLLHIHYLQHPRSVVNFSSPMGWLNNIHSKMEISKNTANHMRSESQQISSTSGVWLFLEFGVQFSCAYPTPRRWI